MIPAATITAWGSMRPWPNRLAIEQDLLLARTIIAIYSNRHLRDELVFRGGTCLHQLHLPRPRRYSEDLDFVRTTHSGIGDIFDALRDVAQDVGLSVQGTKVGKHPKMRLRAYAEDDPDLALRLKVEINTHETSPAKPLVRMPLGLSTAWFTGEADVLTFTPGELVSTKLRALYQRKKGRDLFDLWLALTDLRVSPSDILASFEPYRPHGYTSGAAIANLEAKTRDAEFCADLEPLVGDWPDGYDIRSAADLVCEQLLSKL